MCLLVKQPASTVFTDEFLKDVYSKNQDGFGIMYAEAGKVHVFKCLPTNAAEFIDFYRKHAEGKDCVWHARMQTHGDVDLENCHPYRVTDTIWMSHNGVLSTGNDADATRSDTWHFIRNVLSPSLQSDPDLILDQDWLDFIGSMIGGSNKFGFVRADGEIAIVNQRSGVEFVGAWLSNTYAWSANTFGFRPKETPRYYSGHYDTYQSQLAWDGYYGSHLGSRVGKTYEAKGSWVKDEPTVPSQAVVRPYIKAAYNQWTRHGLAGIEQWIKDAPYKAAAVLSFWYEDPSVEDFVEDDPEEAAVWIEELFTTDSVSPSMLV